MERSWIPRYVVIAILLGVVVMALPLSLLLVVPAGYSRTSGSQRWSSEEGSGECPEQPYEGLLGTKSKEVRLDGAMANLPSSLVYAGMASAVSLAVALGAYSFSRRRVTA